MEDGAGYGGFYVECTEKWECDEFKLFWCLQRKISDGCLLKPRSLSSVQCEQRTYVMIGDVWKTGQNLKAPQYLRAVDFHTSHTSVQIRYLQSVTWCSGDVKQLICHFPLHFFGN